ncbi:MAG: hypothetical protein CVU46_17245 [Chloroflexi bacterium HGW-Chloroflexi-8]|jgi:hypothetical protein|nr:MAG: hypothetical protein CVU46_17245 [Chloroflexi bacterium HGW-Chloroflexi-8]
MKSVSQPSVLNPAVFALLFLFAAVMAVAMSGKRIPLLSNLKVDIILLVVIGMAICMSGIGRVAAMNQWTHPLAILGSLLGVLILVVAAAALFGWKLPLIQNDTQSMIAITLLLVLKIANTFIHSLLP